MSQKHRTLVRRHSRDYHQRVADGTGYAGVTAGTHARPLPVLRHQASTQSGGHQNSVQAVCRPGIPLRDRP